MDGAMVSGLYQRYKSGTKHVTQWLLDTARQHLKTRNNLTLTTENLVQLSECIAKAATKAGKAPAGIEAVLTVLRDAIAGRKECAAWYSAQTTADAGHENFVLVLKRILQTLENVCAGSKVSYRSSNANGTYMPDRSTAIGNTFAALSIEDTLSNDQEVDTVSVRSRSVPEPLEAIDAQLETLADDGIFAVWCYFRECRDLRTLVGNVWREYQDGDVSLMVAGQVTDVTFSLIQEAANRLMEEFPRFTNFEAVAKEIGMKFKHEEDSLFFSYHHDKGLSGIDGDSHAFELLCMQSFALLDVWRRLLEHGNDEGCRSQLPQLHPLGAAIAMHMSDFRVLCKNEKTCGDLLGCDAYTRDIMMFLRSRAVTLSFLVETRIYMGIYTLNRGTMGQNTWISREIADHLRKLYLWIERHFRDQPQLRSVYGDCCAGQSINVAENVSRVVGDPLIEQDGEVVHAQWASWQKLFGQFPVLGGVYLAKLANAKEMDGIHISNIKAGLVSAVHLYEACRSSGALDVVWPDMEHVKEKHKVKLGLRDLPKGKTWSAAAARYFKLAVGGRLTDCADHKRRKRTGAPTQTSVTWKVKSSLEASSAYAQILLKMTSTVDGATADASSYNLHELAKRLLADDAQRVEDNIKKQWIESRALTPLQLLSVYKTSLMRNELVVMFDYQELFFHWIRLMSDLLECAPGMGLHVDDTANLPFHTLVDEVLRHADDLTNLHGRPKETLLQWVARLMKIYIDHHGSACLSKARDLCSGSLVARYRPCDNLDEDVLKKIEARGDVRDPANEVREKGVEAESVSKPDDIVIFGQSQGRRFFFEPQAFGVVPKN